MKLTKMVNIDVEVEFHVSIEEMLAEIASSNQSQFYIKQGLSNLFAFLRGIPDEEIERMEELSKKLVYDRITEQIQRFKPQSKG